MLLLFLDLPAVAHPVVVTDRTSNIGAVLSGVAAICSAVIWPVLIGLILWWFREPAGELLHAAVGVAEGATRFKIWQIEFDKDVQQQVAQSESAALVAPVLQSPAAGARAEDLAGSTELSASPSVAASQLASSIPGGEVAAAARVRSLLDTAPNATLREAAEAAIKARMESFAQGYETTRASMRAGPERTRAMNGVVAKMRTLALASDFLLDEYMEASSPGKRLAAVCILQMKPEMRAVPWLADRMRVEQPFVFFHASVALLNAVRRFGEAEKPTLQRSIEAALKQVQSFGEHADTNTVRSLTLALSELATSS